MSEHFGRVNCCHLSGDWICSDGCWRDTEEEIWHKLWLLRQSHPQKMGIGDRIVPSEWEFRFPKTTNFWAAPIGHVGKNEEIFWQTISDFQSHTMSIHHHNDLARKECKAQWFSTWKIITIQQYITTGWYNINCQQQKKYINYMVLCNIKSI
jgi:hypothetical protein